MQEIREWIMSISVTLIITGLISKLVPSKANKSVINFVITLVIIITVFGFDINDAADIFNFEFDQSTIAQEELSEELNEEVRNVLENTAKERIISTINSYDASASAEIEFNDENTVIYVTSNNLTTAQKNALETEIRADFEGVIYFEYSAVG